MVVFILEIANVFAKNLIEHSPKHQLIKLPKLNPKIVNFEEE